MTAANIDRRTIALLVRQPTANTALEGIVLPIGAYPNG
jgi:hypothetical protein